MDQPAITLEPIATPAADCAEVKLARHLRERHRFMLWVAIIVVAASFALRFRQGEALRLPGTDVSLPVMCGSRMFFGVECPGCGLTRSFVALAAGDFKESLRFNRVGWILALALVAQIPYRIIALREIRGRIVQRTWPVWFGYFLIAALIINWLLKISGI
jgi:hypothetical protein